MKTATDLPVYQEQDIFNLLLLEKTAKSTSYQSIGNQLQKPADSTPVAKNTQQINTTGLEEQLNTANIIVKRRKPIITQTVLRRFLDFCLTYSDITADLLTTLLTNIDNTRSSKEQQNTAIQAFNDMLEDLKKHSKQLEAEFIFLKNRLDFKVIDTERTTRFLHNFLQSNDGLSELLQYLSASEKEIATQIHAFILSLTRAITNATEYAPKIQSLQNFFLHATLNKTTLPILRKIYKELIEPDRTIYKEGLSLVAEQLDLNKSDKFIKSVRMKLKCISQLPDAALTDKLNQLERLEGQCRSKQMIYLKALSTWKNEKIDIEKKFSQTIEKLKLYVSKIKDTMPDTVNFLFFYQEEMRLALHKMMLCRMSNNMLYALFGEIKRVTISIKQKNVKDAKDTPEIITHHFRLPPP